MDLALPRMDGWEATRRIRADPQLSDIPVLAITALTMESDERRARGRGAWTNTSQSRCGQSKIRAWSAATWGRTTATMTSTVLIVDDNPDSIMVLRTILESKASQF
jgi:CheY-like chemotaxis protein